jgi:hypothetical protein
MELRRRSYYIEDKNRIHIKKQLEKQIAKRI